MRACDRLTQQAAERKRRIKDLVRQLLPVSPLPGDLGQADLVVLERTGADPHALLRRGPARLARLIRTASTAYQDPQRASHWLAAARAAAVCVVAAHLAERAWEVCDRAMPYVVCDTDGTPVTPEQARQVIAERWTVPEEVRQRRRSRKARGKAPQQVLAGRATGARSATRRPSPPASLGRHDPNVKPAHRPA